MLVVYSWDMFVSVRGDFVCRCFNVCVRCVLDVVASILKKCVQVPIVYVGYSCICVTCR